MTCQFDEPAEPKNDSDSSEFGDDQHALAADHAQNAPQQRTVNGLGDVVLRGGRRQAEHGRHGSAQESRQQHLRDQELLPLRGSRSNQTTAGSSPDAAIPGDDYPRK